MSFINRESVVCIYHKIGMICGQMESVEGDVVKIRHPVILSLTEKGITISNMLGLVQQDDASLTTTDWVFADMFTPAEEVLGFYEQFVSQHYQEPVEQTIIQPTQPSLILPS